MRLSIPFLLLLPLFGSTQKVSNVDLDAIEERVSDSNSTYFFPKLKERLLAFDTSLSIKAYKQLYYGSALVENSSSALNSDSDTLDKSIKGGHYERGIAIGKQKLQGAPVNLDTWYKLMVAYHQSGKKDSAELVGRIYYSFLQVIYRSGEGRSKDSAFVVKSVNDEYQVLRDQKLRMVGQSLLKTDNGPVDKMTVKPAKGERGGSEPQELVLYFNVTLPFNDYQKMFKGSDKEKEDVKEE